MIMVGSLTAEGAECLAEVAEKNSLPSSAKTSASSAVKNQHPQLRRDFIFRFRHALEPMIEPADDVLQALDAMPGLARA